MSDQARMVLSIGAAVLFAVVFTLVVVARADRYEERMMNHADQEGT